MTFEGLIEEVLPDGRFRVLLGNQHEVLAYTAGKMRRFRIRTVSGDRVHVEMTPYDLTNGRLVYASRRREAAVLDGGPSGAKTSHSPCRPRCGRSRIPCTTLSRPRRALRGAAFRFPTRPTSQPPGPPDLRSGSPPRSSRAPNCVASWRRWWAEYRPCFRPTIAIGERP